MGGLNSFKIIIELDHKKSLFVFEPKVLRDLRPLDFLTISVVKDSTLVVTYLFSFSLFWAQESYWGSEIILRFFFGIGIRVLVILFGTGYLRRQRSSVWAQEGFRRE